jgi:crossover junction endodeoxyribonuclease RusA
MKIVLEGNPISTNTIYKTSNRRFIYMTSEGKDLKEYYQLQAMQQWKKKILENNIKIKVNLYFKDKKRRDIDNWHKLSLDALTGIVWKDDSQIFEMTIKKNIDKNNPRIEIEIITGMQ